MASTTVSPANPANAEKTAAVAEIVEAFRGSSAALLTEYRGLTVTEITELRRALGSGTRYAVVKNTLTKIAAGEAGVEGIDEMLAGPTAIAFVTGDPVEAAKGLRDFARTHPLLVVKGGVLDGRPLSPTEIARLADLESREVLLAKLAGALQGSLSQAVRLFAAPLTQVARMAAALEAKAQEDPSILRGGAGTPAAEPETEAPVAVADAEPVAEPAASSDPEPAASSDPEPAASSDPEPAASSDPEPAASSDPEPAASSDPEPAASSDPAEPEPTDAVSEVADAIAPQPDPETTDQPSE